jgi:hypothetical protein
VSLLASIVWGLVLGGVVLQAIQHVASLTVLYLGRDPEKLWVDNLVAGIAGILLLLAFQNSWLTIFVFAVSLVVLGGWKHVRARAKPGRSQG